uniref:Uncharacterized protein n=1 Tax=Desertifilum tharense IPPAS B-1220 TaxID=1781255 RepID=A0ACD5GPG9_9CYAN
MQLKALTLTLSPGRGNRSLTPYHLPHSAHCYAEANATALSTQHSLSPHPLLTRNSELGTLHSFPPSPHLPIPPPSSHSELGTRNFALFSPIPPSPHPPTLFSLGTRNSELCTLFPHPPISPPPHLQYFTRSTAFCHC